MIFGLMTRDNYYQVLLVASKKAITQKWLQIKFPSRNDWINTYNAWKNWPSPYDYGLTWSNGPLD